MDAYGWMTMDGGVPDTHLTWLEVVVYKVKLDFSREETPSLLAV